MNNTLSVCSWLQYMVFNLCPPQRSLSFYDCFEDYAKWEYSSDLDSTGRKLLFTIIEIFVGTFRGRHHITYAGTSKVSPRVPAPCEGNKQQFYLTKYWIKQPVLLQNNFNKNKRSKTAHLATPSLKDVKLSVPTI